MNLWRRARAAVASMFAHPTPFNLLPGVFPGATGPAPTRGTAAALDVFAIAPWLHAAADKVASSIASVQWRLYAVRARGATRARRVRDLERASGAARTKMLDAYRDRGELVEIAEHPLLDVLDHANAMMTGYAFRKTLALHIDLAGDAYLLRERNGLGVVVGLWPIPAHWILALPTPSHLFFRVGYRGWHGAIPASEIIVISNPSPANPFGRGVGMAQALADEIETDEYAARFTKNFFFNQARPDILVYPKGEDAPGRPSSWNDAQRLRLEQEWTSKHQGFQRAFKPMFANRELGIHEFQAGDFRSLQFVQMREFLRDTVRQVWGIPPEIMGILEPGSNRATITQAQNIYARHVLVPRLELIRCALQESWVPDYDARLVLDYVSPVESDPELELAAATAAPYALTLNDWRRLSGHTPLEGVEGSSLPLAPGVQLHELGTLSDVSTRELLVAWKREWLKGHR